MDQKQIDIILDTVRKALQELEGDGTLTISKYHGWIDVDERTKKEHSYVIRELYTTRRRFPHEQD